MSVLRERLRSSGVDGGEDADLRIFVYPNSDAQVPNNIPDGLSVLGDKAINIGACSSYGIWQDYRYPNLEKSNKSELLRAWRDYNKPDDRGLHMLLTGNLSLTLGIADSPANSGAWSGKYHAVSTNGGSNPQVTAIHEALHTFVDQTIQSVSADHKTVEHGHRDHDLGQIFATDQTSPLAKGYEDSHAQHGSCSGGVLPLGVTKRLSECTKNGLKETADNAGF